MEEKKTGTGSHVFDLWLHQLLWIRLEKRAEQEFHHLKGVQLQRRGLQTATARSTTMTWEILETSFFSLKWSCIYNTNIEMLLQPVSTIINICRFGKNMIKLWVPTVPSSKNGIPKWWTLEAVTLEQQKDASGLPKLFEKREQKVALNISEPPGRSSCSSTPLSDRPRSGKLSR